MVTLDIAVVIFYFVIVLGIGFWYRHKASRDLDAYFLGGKRIHWFALAMSGSVSNFDITGTMWIVSIIYLLGMKSMWHHWMWGFMLGAFFLAYMGKWVRRSNVMTAAEWMKTRFGDGLDGRIARLAYALMAVLLQASFIGYAFQGIGKFAAIYIPLERLGGITGQPWLGRLATEHEAAILALLIIGITTLYVLMGGLYSVVVTDVIQTIVLTVSAIYIAGLAWARIPPAQLARLPDDFASLRIPWRLPELAGTPHESYVFFGPLVMVWVLKGLLLNAGGPGQMYDFQRFLAARNPRDACKLGAAWSGFLIVRWGMAMGIALFALTGVAGVEDAEQVMPLVLRDILPAGVRGIVIAGLLAAFMSTFSSTVNSGASFIVRDIWQLFINPEPTDRQAIRMSYWATGLIVLIGIVIGFQGESIAEIWSWMMMALGAGVIIPNVLRWYWWRFNAWGYAWGTLGGIALSVLALVQPDLPIWIVFPIIIVASSAFSLIVTLRTAPTDRSILVGFYRSVRPFGAWAPIRRASGLTAEQLNQPSENASQAILNVILAMIAIFSLYVFPMYWVGHWYGRCIVFLAAAIICIVIMKFTWYDNLPPVEPDEELISS